MPKAAGQVGLDHLGQQAAARGLLVGARPEGGATSGQLGVEAQADEDVHGQLVGRLGLGGVVGVVQLGHPGAAEDQTAPHGPGHAAQAAALADGHVAAAERRWGVAQLGPGPYGRDQLGVGVAGLEADQLAQRGRADDGVDRQPGVALELGQAPGRGVAEDAVDPAGVEAEGAQALLEVGHVVAALHGGAPVQEAVTEVEAGLDQGVPGLVAADAVDPDAPDVLEGLDGGPGPGAEDAVGVDAGAGQDGGQAVLDVRDRLAAVPEGEGQAYR